MATAAPKLAPFDYTLESDADAQVKTVFKLRPLNSFEYIQAADIAGGRTRAESSQYVLKTALLGWSHFVDAAGAEIEFSKKHSENLERLTIAQVNELTTRILEVSALDETERKN
jgi:hypothetical protein